MFQKTDVVIICGYIKQRNSCQLVGQPQERVGVTFNLFVIRLLYIVLADQTARSPSVFYNFQLIKFLF